MRYVTVGDVYKNPETPLWVLGSPTHYTLVFALDGSACKVSKVQKLEQKTRKAFSEVQIDDGLAMVDVLEELLRKLELPLSGEADPDAARRKIIQAGSEVFLWNDFWEYVKSRASGKEAQKEEG